MNHFQRLALTAAFGLAAGIPVAQAVPFSITSASFTPDNGYGIDSNERYGNELDVRFNTSGFSPQNFSLNSIGSSYTFQVGTVDLEESNSYGGISANETDHLDVTTTMTFTNPLGTVLNIVVTGIAYVGAVSDAKVDYTLAWDPVFVNFGTNGQFELSLDRLYFTGRGTENQTATVTLWSADTAGVPEPATTALIGLGLGALGWSRRRRSR